MAEIVIEPSAERAMKKLRKSDFEAARRLQVLIDQVLAGITPQGSARMCGGSNARKALGTVPFKVADGKLRMIFVPGERIIALGYRRDVYTVLGTNAHWAN